MSTSQKTTLISAIILGISCFLLFACAGITASSTTSHSQVIVPRVSPTATPN